MKNNIETTKRVQWSYSTSPNACKLGFGNRGCWSVEIVAGGYNAAISGEAIAGYTDFDSAKQAADLMAIPYNRFTCEQPTDCLIPVTRNQ